MRSHRLQAEPPSSGPAGSPGKTLLTLACLVAAFTASHTIAPASALAQDFAFITTTDYETGSSAVIELDGSWTTTVDAASIHSDAVSRWYDGLIYVVNRMNGDNIQVLDPENGFSTLRQYSTGNGTNPQDIAFRSATKAYITLYDRNEILVMNPVTGSHDGSIDLSILADADGLCEVNMLYIKHDILFASVQRLDRSNYWGPSGESYIAVVDCAVDTLIDTDPAVPGTQPVLLAGSNPVSQLVFDETSGHLLVSCAGWWGMQDGGIEAIDMTSYESLGYIFTETAAGGDINDFVIFDGSKGYAIITNASFNTELIGFDPSTGAKGASIYSPGAYVINDIELSPDGELFLADQTITAPGIRIYDAATGIESTGSPISTGLPPFQITFSRNSLSGGDIPAAAGLERSYPNPFNPSTTIACFLPEAAQIRLEIFSVSGRRIRTLADGRREAGRHLEIWDGRDDSGRPCVSGVYFLRFCSGEIRECRKLVLMR